jgi:hypothetical protein
MRSARQYVVWLFAPTFLLAACLFPSFDNLTGPAQTAGQEPSSTEGGKDGSTDGSTDGKKPTGSTQDGSDPAPNPTGDGSTAPPKRINCGSGGTCDPASSFCCFAFGSPSCKPNSDVPFCESTIRCDGNEDCATGQVCCLPSGGPRTSSCMGSCDGAIICDPINPQCPTGKSCKVEHDHDGTFKSFSCQ